MKIIQKLILTSLFIVSNISAQDLNLANALTNNASIGMNIGMMSTISSSPEVERNISIRYTKQINYLLALQGGFISGTIPDSHHGNDFNGLTANGMINLSNLSFGSNSRSILYISAGGKLLYTEKEGKELLTNLGGGLKYAINNQHQNIDLDLSASQAINPMNDNKNAYMLLGLGINYRFNEKDEAVEWNNPLDAIYQDLADLKTKVDSASENELQPILTKIRVQDAQISSNNNDLKNIFKITKSSIKELERLNNEIDDLKGNNEPLFIESVNESEITIGFHIIAGSFASKTNAQKMVKKLQSEGFDSIIIGQNTKGLYRVVMQSFKNKKEALDEMQNLKASGRTVWLLE